MLSELFLPAGTTRLQQVFAGQANRWRQFRERKLRDLWNGRWSKSTRRLQCDWIRAST